MRKQKKPAKKNHKVHGQMKTRVWVTGSKNSKKLFLLTIMDVAPPEILFSKAFSAGLQQQKGDVFFLFANPELSGATKPSASADLVTEHYIKLTVNWRNLKPGDKILDAKTKKVKLTGNLDFPIPWAPDFVQLTTLTTDITDADAKLLARSQNLPDSAKNLDVAVKLLYKDVKKIGAMVQLKMDDCIPDEAIRMCSAAGYTYKAIAVRGPRPNRVRRMTEPGWVQADGTGEGGRDWQFSLAPFAEAPVIKDLEYQTKGVIQYNVGQSRVDAWFRWRLVFRKGRRGDWSEWYKGETP